jgi:hypothetical protein
VIKDKNPEGLSIDKLEYYFEGTSAIQLFYKGKEA